MQCWRVSGCVAVAAGALIRRRNPSWPGVSRPSFQGPKKDTRDKPAYDEVIGDELLLPQPFCSFSRKGTVG